MLLIYTSKILDTVMTLPKNMLPGLDFYQGVMLAIDSLQVDHANIEVTIIDSKNSKEPIAMVLAKPMWDSVSLIIASFKERSEIKPMADFALLKKIPLISATLPNDGGIADNPYFILLNPTLQTHTQGHFTQFSMIVPHETDDLGRLLVREIVVSKQTAISITLDLLDTQHFVTITINSQVQKVTT